MRREVHRDGADRALARPRSAPRPRRRRAGAGPRRLRPAASPPSSVDVHGRARGEALVTSSVAICGKSGRSVLDPERAAGVSDERGGAQRARRRRGQRLSPSRVGILGHGRAPGSVHRPGLSRRESEQKKRHRRLAARWLRGVFLGKSPSLAMGAGGRLDFFVGAAIRRTALLYLSRRRGARGGAMARIAARPVSTNVWATPRTQTAL